MLGPAGQTPTHMLRQRHPLAGTQIVALSSHHSAFSVQGLLFVVHGAIPRSAWTSPKASTHAPTPRRKVSWESHAKDGSSSPRRKTTSCSCRMQLGFGFSHFDVPSCTLGFTLYCVSSSLHSRYDRRLVRPVPSLPLLHADGVAVFQTALATSVQRAQPLGSWVAKVTPVRMLTCLSLSSQQTPRDWSSSHMDFCRSTGHSSPCTLVWSLRCTRTLTCTVQPSPKPIAGESEFNQECQAPGTEQCCFGDVGGRWSEEC